MTDIEQPRVTIVMTARERHALTEAALDAIAAETSLPHRLVYVDVDSPGWLREVLEARAAEWRLERVRFDEPLWPQDARARVLPDIATEYVVFIDNDVVVEPGWLEALVGCADETGAGLVAPLYLWGDGVRPPKVHMAGGRLIETRTAEGMVLEDTHLHANADPRAVPLARMRCDFGEYHCMLMRTAPLREHGVLDPSIRCVHEHIDTALGLAAHGHEAWLEPSARVTYLAFADYMLDELSFFRARWDPAEGDASIAAFCRKWNVLDHPEAFDPVRQFLRDHVALVDPIRPANRARPDAAAPMQRDELAHNRSELLDAAAARGYGDGELRLLSNSYQLAHMLMDGGYRPCGRPFVDHLVGTASVLVRYGFRADVVAAGLLHAAYTHCPPHAGSARTAIDTVAGWLGGRGTAVESRVRQYALRGEGSGAAFDAASAALVDAEIVAMVAANEVDLHLSGEFRYSGRTDAIGEVRMADIRTVCDALGVPGLHRTLDRERAAPNLPPAGLVTGMPTSYRIGPDRRTAVPMANPVLRAVGVAPD